MLPEKQTKTNVGVGLGVLLQFAGLLLFQTGNTAAILGIVLMLVSIPVHVWGCMNYAEGKGHSKWVGLVGVVGIPGLIILIVLPDQDPSLSDKAPSQRSKVLALISLVVGFGLFVIGRWLNDLGDDVRLERLLHPWPAVCMALGFFVAVVSVSFMIQSPAAKGKESPMR